MVQEIDNSYFENPKKEVKKLLKVNDASVKIIANSLHDYELEKINKAIKHVYISPVNSLNKEFSIDFVDTDELDAFKFIYENLLKGITFNLEYKIGYRSIIHKNCKITTTSPLVFDAKDTNSIIFSIEGLFESYEVI